MVALCNWRPKTHTFQDVVISPWNARHAGAYTGVTSAFLLLLWLTYVVLSALKAYGTI